MVECPNCRHRTLSRWQARAICPNCGAVIRPRILPRFFLIFVPWMGVALVQSPMIGELALWQVMSAQLSV